MNSISHYIYRIESEIFAKLKLSRAFKTSCGLKNVNMSMFVPSLEIEGKEAVEILSDELYLGYDYLRDDYTLLDTPIDKSPHYALMKCLYENDDLSNCDYIKRWLSGTLDWRYGYKKPKDFSFFINRYKDAKKNIEKNQIKPIIAYKLGEKYYIYDGKHRAAMCAYNKIPVPCFVFDAEDIIKGVWVDLFEKIKDDKHYKKHKKLYSAYQSREVQ